MRKLIIICCALGLGMNLFAQEEFTIPDFNEAIRLGENINTTAEECKMVLNEEGTIMYFIRAYHKENTGYDEAPQNEDVWESIKNENGEWGLAIHETTINDEANNSIIGKGKEGHYFLLNTYQKRNKLVYGIALTTKEAEHKWTKPEVIEIPKLKYMGDFYDFYITHDEQVLMISIQGEDSKGVEDLYVSFNKGEGKWSEPVNLGDKINTKGYEMSPFLSEDKTHLYFSTNGREDGLGNADVYMTERLDDSWTNWSDPKNMGDVINSTGMDCYYTISDNGEYYFASNRNKETGLDIYQAMVKPIEPPVVDTPAVVAVVDTPAVVEPVVVVPVVVPVKEFPKDFQLKMVQHGFNQTNHTSGTKVNIDDVTKVMDENPWMKIVIESHTDSKGSESYNLALSKKRAVGARDYLIRQGISGARIRTKYYGEANPIAPNANSDGSDNPSGRAKNRRTEFKVVSNESGATN